MTTTVPCKVSKLLATNRRQIAPFLCQLIIPTCHLNSSISNEQHRKLNPFSPGENNFSPINSTFFNSIQYYSELISCRNKGFSACQTPNENIHGRWCIGDVSVDWIGSLARNERFRWSWPRVHFYDLLQETLRRARFLDLARAGSWDRLDGTETNSRLRNVPRLNYRTHTRTLSYFPHPSNPFHSAFFP